MIEEDSGQGRRQTAMATWVATLGWEADTEVESLPDPVVLVSSRRLDCSTFAVSAQPWVRSAKNPN